MKLLNRISHKKPRSIFRNKMMAPPTTTSNRKLLLSSEESTLASEDPSERGSLMSGRSRKSKQRIQFCEAKNQVFTSEEPAPDMYSQDIWYQKEELEQFRENAQDDGRVNTTRERSYCHDPSWSKTLVATYQSFCRVDSADDMNVIFAALSKVDPIDPSLVGLEAHAIPQLKAARGHRRSQLMLQISRLQSCMDMTRSERARRIRKLSHEASRPARLFALHLAQLVQA